MPRGKKHTAEMIISELREEEFAISKGGTTKEAAKANQCIGTDILPMAQGVPRAACRAGEATEGS